MQWYFRIPLGTRLVVAFLAGGIAGLMLGREASVLAPASRLLVDLLRLLAPVVVATFVLAALSSGSFRGVGALATKTLIACVTLAAAASATGALIAWGLAPVHPSPLPVFAPPRTVAWWTALGEWLPGSTVGMETTVPIVFAITMPLALGIGAWRTARPGGAGDRAHALAVQGSSLVTTVVRWVLEYAPIGTFAAAAVMFGEAGRSAGAQLAGALVAVYAAQAALASAMLAVAGVLRLRPLALLRESREALVTALATGSSAATLPLELRVAEGPLGITPPVARVVMPLGTTFCKVGTTAFLGVLGVVGGLAAGIDPTWPWIARVVGWSTVAGLATPPISGGGFVMLALVFGQTDVPLAWVPVLTGLPVIGKLNTPLNALGRLLLATALRPAGTRASTPSSGASPDAVASPLQRW